MDLQKELLFKVLDKSNVARLALIDRKFLPDAMPIVFGRRENVLFSPVDGKPKKTANLARIKNLEANSNTMLLFDHYSSNWEDLWWLRLVCDAKVVINPGETREYERILYEKYDQYQITEMSKSQTKKTFIIFEVLSLKYWGFLGENSLLKWLEEV